MRKVITGAFISLDGVMQAPGGPEEDVSGGFKFGGWVQPLADNDPVFGEAIGKLFAQPYDLLLGRRTYDIFAAFWPFAEGGPDDGIAKQFNAATKYVATRKGADLSWKNSVALRDAAKDVAKLKQEDGPALLTQGSADLIQTLLAEDLIDELWTFTFPVLLGGGKKLFRDGVKPGALKLVEGKVSPSGMIAAGYVRDGAVKTGDFTTHDPSPAEAARRERVKRGTW
jgi:dihydrofolate reductase